MKKLHNVETHLRLWALFSQGWIGQFHNPGRLSVWAGDHSLPRGSSYNCPHPPSLVGSGTKHVHKARPRTSKRLSRNRDVEAKAVDFSLLRSTANPSFNNLYRSKNTFSHLCLTLAFLLQFRELQALSQLWI